MFSWQMIIIGAGFETIKLLAISVSLSETESKALELFESTNTSVELYLLLEVLKLILSISLNSLMT